MRIALAQINVKIADFAANTAKMLACARVARAAGCRLVVFPELALTGYPPRDLLEFAPFLKASMAALRTLAEATVGGDDRIAILVGGPAPNPVVEGKDLYNAAFLLDGGEVVHTTHKALLPTYDVFDEYRYFEPGRETSVATLDGLRLAITICEDLWNLGQNPLYLKSPMEQLAAQGADVMLNIAASPFSMSQAETRARVLQENAATYGLPLLYVNHVGAHTEIIFDGGGLAIDGQGRTVERMPFFAEGLYAYEVEAGSSVPVPVGSIDCGALDTKGCPGSASAMRGDVLPHPLERARGGLVMGIHDYFKKSGLTRAVLGLSGGIDSAVVAVLAAEALGKDNVDVLLLPGPYSSEHSKDDARALAERIGLQHHQLGIGPVYDSALAALAPALGGGEFGLPEENIQARLRGLFLMAYSNKHGHILLNTTNKSEAAVGYGTLYGDMAGGLAILGDLYKTQVYGLAALLNGGAGDGLNDGGRIPQNTISKPPSAELRPNQTDQDSLPPYEVLDVVLHHYIEQRLGKEQIIAHGHDRALVERVLRLVNASEHKRHQMPPVLRVSTKAFGQGRRMPIVASYGAL